MHAKSHILPRDSAKQALQDTLELDHNKQYLRFDHEAPPGISVPATNLAQVDTEKRCVETRTVRSDGRMQRQPPHRREHRTTPRVVYNRPISSGGVKGRVEGNGSKGEERKKKKEKQSKKNSGKVCDI